MNESEHVESPVRHVAPLEAQLKKVRSQSDGPPSADALLDAFVSYCEDAGFSLYEAQEEAVMEIFSGNHVILATPTGSGKSLVALAMHFKGLAENKVSFYTAPIKALVNEKFFSLCRTLGAENVGLMTGDASVNADAPVICATAEILSNMALRDGKLADVDYVVMDEFHFYSDHERGVAWQIPLLTMPQSRFLLMSATIGDTALFEESIEELTGVPVALVRSDQRPVPLDFEYRRTPIHETISELLSEGKTPIYIVHFTQRETGTQAQALMSMNFLEKEEKQAIKAVLREHRLTSPFGKELRRWLPHGVGVHHAGMLPKYRLLVEKLAQKGMLKVICGTDTLGVGVNIPIRTVLFTKLCKYNGKETRVLTVRDFKQIAGRAGRKGFDDQGSCVAQAPEHVIENMVAEQKAAANPKKLKKLRKKSPPERGYAHFDEATFEKLIASDPEPLESRFSVDHGMILNLLSRQEAPGAKPKEGCHAIRSIIDLSHESDKSKRALRLRAVKMLRSLVDANIVSLGPDGARPNVELQADFSLNRTLSLYVVEALDLFDKEADDYALDVLTLVEATLEDPHAVLRKQLDQIKTEAITRMKAEGIEYEERMERLEKLENPKPKAELLYGAFNVFRDHHPWVQGENIRPKSIARELFEMGATFNEYVKHLGLQRSEGVLLRHLSSAYKALVQNVPEDQKTDEVYDVTEWLGGVVRGVDASLLDEWEHLKNPDAPRAVEEEVAETSDITTNKTTFRVLIRNAVWRVLQAIARKDATRMVSLTTGDDRDDKVVERVDEVERQMSAYYTEHELIHVDPKARNPALMQMDADEDSGNLRVTQTVSDPNDDHDWKLRVTVDKALSAELGEVVLRDAELVQL